MNQNHKIQLLDDENLIIDSSESTCEFANVELANLKDEDDEIPRFGLNESILIVASIAELMKEQKAFGNVKLLEDFFAIKPNHPSDKVLLEETNQLKRQRTMQIAWPRNKHLATMSYR